MLVARVQRGQRGGLTSCRSRTSPSHWSGGGICISIRGDLRWGTTHESVADAEVVSVVLGERARSAAEHAMIADAATYDSVPLEMTVVLRLSVGRDEVSEIGGDGVGVNIAEESVNVVEESVNVVEKSVTAVVVSTCGAAATVPARARATRSTRERARAMASGLAGMRNEGGLYNTDVQAGEQWLRRETDGVGACARCALMYRVRATRQTLDPCGSIN